MHVPNFLRVLATVEPLIKDPPRKGNCMLNLSIRDTVKVFGVPKTTIPYSFYSMRTSEERTTSL